MNFAGPAWLHTGQFENKATICIARLANIGPPDAKYDGTHIVGVALEMLKENFKQTTGRCEKNVWKLAESHLPKFIVKLCSFTATILF
jgi:hypothetical protein